MTSSMRMRTQPCDAACPIVPYSEGSMPWMPAPLKMPSHRAFSGSSGPGGTVFPASLPAQVGAGRDGLSRELARPGRVRDVPDRVHRLVLDVVEPGRRLEALHPDGDGV